MKNLKLNILAAALVAAACAWPFQAPAAESKYDTHTNLAEIIFAPNPYGQRVITSILASSDVGTGAVKLYGRSGSKVLASEAETNGQFTITVADNLAITNADTIVYVYSDGATPLVTTAGVCTATSIKLGTAISQAGTTADAIYEIAQQGELKIGTTALNLAGYTVWASPGDSPVYITVNANTAAVLTATSE